jgi:GT2 family glycosyltransferase
VRRAAWAEVGGFDEHQWMYAEDLDLGWRMNRAGWQTRYVAAARVQHRHAAAAEIAWGEQRTERWVRATYDWMSERRGSMRTRAVAAVNVTGALLRALAELPRIARGRPDARALHHEWRRWARLHCSGLRATRGQSWRNSSR